MKVNVALIGMPGSGKTNVGKLLSKNLDMMLADTDEIIEYELSYTIAEIFQKFGENAFRKEESRVIQRLATYENIIIVSGGGAILNESNMQALKGSCYIVYLRVNVDVLLDRLSNDKTQRPLLANLTKENLEKLFDERKALYEKYADVIIDTSNLTLLRTKNAILRYLKALAQNGK